ncbi:hypothetical protein DPMN_012212 [Dreissena polymorpha]|uniref:Uncharacterized protein n=1 Tax=Dreissena polymorpha TaxID=45954 RepID=A0A9D4S359_DREPO|nr:hypothetical protein DPMN_012212 [Dreissena polymorpha]
MANGGIWWKLVANLETGSVKPSMRAHKQNYRETLVTVPEEAAYQNRTKDLYSITKRLAGKWTKMEEY